MKSRGGKYGKLGMKPLTAGLIFIGVLVVLVYLAFSADIPFTTPYRIKVVVADAQNIRPQSPVRIAGVNVGTVQAVATKGEGTTAVLTLNLNKEALPIYKDAQVKVRPRIFLEGNFFLDLQPGTPGQPKLHDGDTIPVTQTSGPVQFDQVLTALQSNTRANLQTLIQGYGEALDGKPKPGEDRTQDPSVRGETAAEALNNSLNYSPRALRGLALVNDAALGTGLHDLSRLIAGSQKVAAALNSNEQNLKDLVTNFNTTMAAFADQSGALRSTIALLPGVLDLANSTFTNLNRAFPPTRALAREILPGVRETAPTIAASFPWIRQTQALVSPAELLGLVADLQPAVADLSSVVVESVVLLPQVDLVNRCMTRVVLPTGDKPVDDGFLSTGIENYKEFFQALTSLSGESQNFDGNGSYTRFQTGGGESMVSTGPTGVQTFTGEPLVGNDATSPIGTRPARPSKKPPYNRTFPCYKNQLPNLAAKTGGGF